MLLIRFLVIALFLLLPAGVLIPSAYAVTPPAPVAPVAAKLLVSWKNAATRADGTPLAATEIKQTNIYVTSLASVIVVQQTDGAPTSYSYVLPAGICIKATDGIAATHTDTGGLESATSAVAKVAADICGPKSLPSQPTAVTATAG